jgi:hypothetical protein
LGLPGLASPGRPAGWGSIFSWQEFKLLSLVYV